MKFYSWSIMRLGHAHSGMTMLESLLAISMLSVFTGVVAMVMQFTLRFFDKAESVVQNGSKRSNGVLVDHRQLHIAMDSLVEVLGQPGISLKDIAYPQTVKPIKACTEEPVNDWGLGVFMEKDKIDDLLPPGYRFCVWETAISENVPVPGIYLLQALPQEISASSLPTRRLFCRPSPYC